MRKSRLIFVAAAVLVVGIASAAALFSGEVARMFGYERAGEIPTANRGIDFDRTETTANKVLNGDLHPTAQGTVALSGPDSSAAFGSIAFVTQSPSGHPGGILFVTWRGKGSNLRGYFYTKLPLSSFHAAKDYDGNQTIEILVPCPGVPPNNVFKSSAVVVPLGRPCWYGVSVTLD